MGPLVSVIITTFNRAELVKKAIASVLNQTYGHLELIVVNDCSTDHTNEAVSTFDDRRITYIQHEVNKGEGSRNTGLRHIRGDYVAFLDDDDEWFKDKLDSQVALLNSKPPDVGAVHTGRILLYTRTEREVVTHKRRLDFSGSTLDDLMIDNDICTSTVMVRRRCLDRVGPFDETLPFCQDYDMWIRLAEKYQFAYVDKPLVRYRYHETNLSKNLEGQIRGREMLYAKHAKYFAMSTPGNSRRYYELGLLNCLNGDLKTGRKMYVKAMSLDRLSARPYAAYGLSLLGRRVVRMVLRMPE